jgi:hypothetical protein
MCRINVDVIHVLFLSLPVIPFLPGNHCVKGMPNTFF